MGKIKKAVGIAGVAAGVAYLSKKDNRRKLKEQIDKAVGTFNSSSYVKNLGKPEGTDDAQMVDEGAMTSVQYYNELREDEKESK